MLTSRTCLPADLPRADQAAAGPDPGHRPDRFRQVDDAGGDDRPHQRERVRPHPHDEDPIEFVHTSQKCLINQREVHRDTHGFNEGPASALREDPGHILVGEMRDLETIRRRRPPETDTWCSARLHTRQSAAKTIDRIIDVFPAGEKPMVRLMLSESPRGDLAGAQEGRRRPHRTAHEIDGRHPAIRNLIREDKVAQM